jgi:hypothetical protein
MSPVSPCGRVIATSARWLVHFSPSAGDSPLTVLNPAAGWQPNGRYAAPSFKLSSARWLAETPGRWVHFEWSQPAGWQHLILSRCSVSYIHLVSLETKFNCSSGHDRY